jgi:hypothetical protein
MPSESLDVKLAVLAAQFEFIKKELEEARLARKGQYEKMEEQGKTLTEMGSRLENVEKSLASQAPTIEEFITIKHKVVGAGLAGRWTWVALTAVVGLMCSFRVEIFKWLARS